MPMYTRIIFSSFLLSLLLGFPVRAKDQGAESVLGPGEPSLELVMPMWLSPATEEALPDEKLLAINPYVLQAMGRLPMVLRYIVADKPDLGPFPKDSTFSFAVDLYFLTPKDLGNLLLGKVSQEGGQQGHSIRQKVHDNLDPDFYRANQIPFHGYHFWVTIGWPKSAADESMLREEGYPVFSKGVFATPAEYGITGTLSFFMGDSVEGIQAVDLNRQFVFPEKTFSLKDFSRQQAGTREKSFDAVEYAYLELKLNAMRDQSAEWSKWINDEDKKPTFLMEKSLKFEPPEKTPKADPETNGSI